MAERIRRGAACQGSGPSGICGALGEAGPGLARQLGLLGLSATGICSMIGAGINVLPIMIERNVPGIGPHVLLAYALGIVPAILAALAYAMLASAMPRAGGSYVYASRALHPFLGFIASFSQWFGLSIVIGVVSYLIIPFLRDIAIALTNDLPAMILAVSRLMFAWAEDGIFPRRLAAVNRRWRTPHLAILACGLTASAGIRGSHLAGDFFLGVDILMVSMLVNFLLMSASVLAFPRRNPALAGEVRFVRSRPLQLVIGGSGAAALGALLIIQIVKDLGAPVSAWYFHGTYVWLMVMAAAALVFAREWRNLRRQGVDVRSLFSTLPRQ